MTKKEVRDGLYLALAVMAVITIGDLFFNGVDAYGTFVLDIVLLVLFFLWSIKWYIVGLAIIVFVVKKINDFKVLIKDVIAKLDELNK